MMVQIVETSTFLSPSSLIHLCIDINYKHLYYLPHRPKLIFDSKLHTFILNVTYFSCSKLSLSYMYLYEVISQSYAIITHEISRNELKFIENQNNKFK